MHLLIINCIGKAHYQCKFGMHSGPHIKHGNEANFHAHANNRTSTSTFMSMYRTEKHGRIRCDDRKCSSLSLLPLSLTFSLNGSIIACVSLKNAFNYKPSLQLHFVNDKILLCSYFESLITR